MVNDKTFQIVKLDSPAIALKIERKHFLDEGQSKVIYYYHIIKGDMVLMAITSNGINDVSISPILLENDVELSLSEYNWDNMMCEIFYKIDVSALVSIFRTIRDADIEVRYYVLQTLYDMVLYKDVSFSQDISISVQARSILNTALQNINNKMKRRGIIIDYISDYKKRHYFNKKSFLPKHASKLFLKRLERLKKAAEKAEEAGSFEKAAKWWESYYSLLDNKM